MIIRNENERMHSFTVEVDSFDISDIDTLTVEALVVKYEDRILTAKGTPHKYLRNAVKALRESGVIAPKITIGGSLARLLRQEQNGKNPINRTGFLDGTFQSSQYGFNENDELVNRAYSTDSEGNEVRTRKTDVELLEGVRDGCSCGRIGCLVSMRSDEGIRESRCGRGHDIDYRNPVPTSNIAKNYWNRYSTGIVTESGYHHTHVLRLNKGKMYIEHDIGGKFVCSKRGKDPLRVRFKSFDCVCGRSQCWGNGKHCNASEDGEYFVVGEFVTEGGESFGLGEVILSPRMPDFSELMSLLLKAGAVVTTDPLNPV